MQAGPCPGPHHPGRGLNAGKQGPAPPLTVLRVAQHVCKLSSYLGHVAQVVLQPGAPEPRGRPLPLLLRPLQELRRGGAGRRQALLGAGGMPSALPRCPAVRAPGASTHEPPRRASPMAPRPCLLVQRLDVCLELLHAVCVLARHGAAQPPAAQAAASGSWWAAAAVGTGGDELLGTSTALYTTVRLVQTLLEWGEREEWQRPLALLSKELGQGASWQRKRCSVEKSFGRIVASPPSPSSQVPHRSRSALQCRRCIDRSQRLSRAFDGQAAAPSATNPKHAPMALGGAGRPPVP